MGRNQRDSTSKATFSTGKRGKGHWNRGIGVFFVVIIININITFSLHLLVSFFLFSSGGQYQSGLGQIKPIEA
jgi:hypothetical protein